MSRFWPPGLPITVVSDTLATPQILVWEGRRHPVLRIHERWRVDEGWWGIRAWREYFTLITNTGLLLTLYHDVPRGQWYLQRLYD